MDISHTEARAARIEKLTALSEAISRRDWLQLTEPPTNADLAFLGAFIQTYCLADFNARRTVNALRAISIGDESDFASKLNDLDVIDHLRHGAVAWTGPSNISDSTYMTAEILEMHRVHRHNFAHWVVRRIKNEDAFVMFTKNAAEAKRRDGKVQDVDEAKWALVSIDGLKEELKKLQIHGKFLAEVCAYLEENLPGLRQEHLSRQSGKN